MIFGNTEDLKQYKNQLPKGIYKCLKKMRRFDFASAEDGKYEIKGAGVMSVESPMTEPASARRLEGHCLYVDVVYLIEGDEEIGCQPFSDAKEITEKFPERDLYFFEGSDADETRVHMTPGRFLVCFPEDLHRPLIAGKDGSSKIRKAVLKYPVMK